MRVGWTAPGRFKTQVEHLKFISSIGTPTLLQMTIAEFLANGGHDHHLRKLRRFYGEQVLCAVGRAAAAGRFPRAVSTGVGGENQHCARSDFLPETEVSELHQAELRRAVDGGDGPGAAEAGPAHRANDVKEWSDRGCQAVGSRR